MTEPDDSTNGRLDELLGAYALDALDADERDQLESYLADHPEARAEADRLASAIDEVAASDDDASRPSPDLWDRIATNLPAHPERVGARPVVADELAQRRAHRAPRRVAIAIVSAAAIVLVALLGVAAIRRSDQRASTVASRLEAEADRVAGEPGTRSGTLTGPGGASVRVVVDADGRGFVLPSNLPPLSSDETYQLWSLDHGGPISLGLLGSDPTVAVVGASGNPDQLAITAEPVGGSSSPTSNPVAVGTLS